ncbi:multidrug resistance protein; DLP12 prophage [Thiomonas sp. X19]|uniref:DMT family transporter n=1 Tax=Thiomonas sp. X19 TaxID=1050370 RepID=UPI000B654A20|nr:multidrug efflux SMR transporter [Thiomonas sp. X19]SCC92324.1 multidrug resistance protein; DLP12 prophage [Thiomonas sp. X19]
MHWTYLAIAIVTEVIATSALKATAGFTRFAPAIVVALGYGVSFYFLALVLRTIPVGLTYAIWSGVGMVLISLIGFVVYRQTLDAAAIAGIALIVAGVLVINLFSRSMPH